MSKEFDPHEAVDFIYRTAPLYAAAKADRVYLEEFRKTKKALLMKASGESAIGAQEREAYAHPDYAQLLEGLRAAVAKEEELRWQLISAQMRGELFRTQSANNRAIDRATS